MTILSPDTLPWYRSQVIMAALVSIVTKLLVGFGIIGDIAPEDSEELASLLVLIAGGIADVWVMRTRLVQKASPTITLKR